MSTSLHDAPRLHRSRRSRMVSGVCGGLAEYLGVDPTWVRLAFVAVAMVGGAGVLAYLILAIVLPVDEPGSAVLRGARTREAAGLFLVGLGLIALVGTLGWLSWVDWGAAWPMLLVAVGAVLLLRRR